VSNASQWRKAVFPVKFPHEPLQIIVTPHHSENGLPGTTAKHRGVSQLGSEHLEPTVVTRLNDTRGAPYRWRQAVPAGESVR